MCTILMGPHTKYTSLVFHYIERLNFQRKRELETSQLHLTQVVWIYENKPFGFKMQKKAEKKKLRWFG